MQVQATPIKTTEISRHSICDAYKIINRIQSRTANYGAFFQKEGLPSPAELHFQVQRRIIHLNRHLHALVNFSHNCMDMVVGRGTESVLSSPRSEEAVVCQNEHGTEWNEMFRPGTSISDVWFAAHRYSIAEIDAFDGGLEYMTELMTWVASNEGFAWPSRNFVCIVRDSPFAGPQRCQWLQKAWLHSGRRSSSGNRQKPSPHTPSPPPCAPHDNPRPREPTQQTLITKPP